MSVDSFHTLEVAAVRPETDSAVCITLNVPPALAATFQFQQGQYLTFRRQIDGEEVRRSYSICSGVDEPALQVAVKALDGGKFSGWANSDLKPGDHIGTMAPAGSFTSTLSPQADKNYLCIAAGSGITPVLSIIKSILACEPRSHVTLLYGNQRVQSIMFRDELDRLKNRHMARFQLIHVLSQEQRDVEILNGRITNRKGAELCRHLLDLNAIDDYFLCGPESMIFEVSRGLRGAGVQDQRIHYELFGASATDAAAAVERHQQRARRFAGKVCRVTVKVDGRESTFELPPDGENVLDAALDAGIDLPFACKGGACATCKAQLVGGEVEMDVCHALEPDEIAAGYILTCQAHPLSEEVFIDFDRAV